MGWIAAVGAAILIAAGAAEAGEQAVRHGVEGGRVVHHEAAPGTDADTLFAVASVGKTFTSVAVLRLAERGALTLDAPAAGFLPRDVVAGFGGMAGITLRHLLTMTSGLPDYYTDDYLTDALDDPSLQVAAIALTYGMEDAPLFPPGTAFDYSNTNYTLLGIVLERVTGQPLARVLEDEVFRPAGMADSFLAGSRPLPPDFARGHPDRGTVKRYYAGTGFGDGGVLSTAADLVRFYRALFSGALLSHASLSALQHDPLGEGYGMGLVVDGRIVGHSGGDLGYASLVLMDPARDLIAVELVADEDADTDWPEDWLRQRSR